MSRRHALLAAPVLALLLAGCVPTPVVEEPPTAGYTPTPTPTATSTAPKPTPTLDAGTLPVGIGCDDLIDPQAMYDYNPNVSAVADFAPSPDSAAGQALVSQGVACRWVNQSSGATIDISVVSYTEAGLAAKKAAVAAASTPAPVLGDDGYFDAAGGVGEAQKFSGSYWLTATSTTFFGADDVARLMETATESLG